ncbi:MAG: hypothetical protein ACLPZM_02870 [Thermoplasmata archaeon]
MARSTHSKGNLRVRETLAYAFYHRPRTGVGRARYEGALLGFHDALARSPTPGFRGSAALRLPRVTWGPHRDRPLYVDWYVLSGFGDLDPVREVAYRLPWVDAHRAAAGLFGEGWGSLYATRGRADPPCAPATLSWFSAPSGRGAPILRRWREEGSPNGVLWRRQLALGPSPEYCYFGLTPPPLSLAPRSAVLAPEYLPVPALASAGPK